jgi:hypothetical protein
VTISATSVARLLIGTTKGPVELKGLRREKPAVRRSVVCIGGATERAGIDRAYHDFVARGTGVIEEVFGNGRFRADVSSRIDAGSSWQLGLFTAHALFSASRFATTSAPELLIFATGTVSPIDLSIGEVGYVPQKLKLLIDWVRLIRPAAQEMLVFIPAGNAGEVDADLRQDLSGLGLQLLEVDHVGQVLRHLKLPPIDRQIAAADKVWQGSPYRNLEPFEVQHRDIFFGRGRAREEALERLRRAAAENTAFLIVHGRSGVGKSSLARAALVGDILAQAHEADVWRVGVMTPQRRDETPLAALARTICTALPELINQSWGPEQLCGLFRQSPPDAAAIIGKAIRGIG